MDSKMYKGSLNVDAIKALESKAFQGKSKWLNVTVFVSEEADNFGNHVGVVFSEKNESTGGWDKKYLGNAKDASTIAQTEEAPF